MIVGGKFIQLIEQIRALYTDGMVGEIQNRPTDLATYDDTIINTTPEMIGMHGQALHEIHIFLAPVWMKQSDIDQSIIDRYESVIRLFNSMVTKADSDVEIKEMKPSVLSLNFKGIGHVTVLQSSLYILSNDKRNVINTCHQVADIFKEAGFVVIREKIEATIFGTKGIPKTSEEMILYQKYFEYHIRIQRKNIEDHHPLTMDEIQILEEISQEFETEFLTPVPLSYNRSKIGTDGGYQRYLNVRFREFGSDDAYDRVKQIIGRINDTTVFKVIKVISEYVWYDTFTALDEGWIDF